MISLTTAHITANSFLTATSTSFTTNEPEPTLLYFIPGNPGLISYYHTYLSLLSSYLSSGADDSAGDGDIDNPKRRNKGHIPQCIIHGKSMGGFEIIGNEEDLSSGGPSIANMPRKIHEGIEGEAQSQPHYQSTDKWMYSLAEQIDHVERNLNDFVDAWHVTREQTRKKVDDGQEQQGKGVKLILIGHSVGAYIAMEVLRRHMEKYKGKKTYAGESGCTVDIIGGILLFPTVVDIAKSSSGRKLTQLLYIPYLAFLTSLLVKILVFILPESWLRSVVETFMGSPPGNAVDTTMRFLKSKRGVEQAIHMAADEMREITSDKWSDEIWGIASSSSAPSPMSASTATSTPAKPSMNLVLYFAQQDHWVADQTRDEIIRVRGGMVNGMGSNGPRMQVCEDGVVHGFCIRHSDIMAKKTAEWVKNIIQG